MSQSNFGAGGSKSFSPPNATPVTVRQTGPMPLGPMRNSVQMPVSPVPDQGAPIPIPRPTQKTEPAPQLSGRGSPSGRMAGGSSSPFWGQQQPVNAEVHVNSRPAQVHQFEVLGEGPDGSQQSFVHEVEFPAAVRVLGIRHLSG